MHRWVVAEAVLGDQSTHVADHPIETGAGAQERLIVRQRCGQLIGVNFAAR